MQKIGTFLAATAVACITSFGILTGGCGSDTGGSGGGGGGGTAKQALFGPCAADSDCDSGLTCATDDPGGQCIKTGCTKDSECPSGSLCTDENNCYKKCGSGSDCDRSGYACVDAMDVTGTAIKTCDVAGG